MILNQNQSIIEYQDKGDQSSHGFKYKLDGQDKAFESQKGYQAIIKSDKIFLLINRNETELFKNKDYQTLTCVTVYNQKSWDLQRTLKGIASSSRGIEGYKLVVVVFDGLEKMNNQKDPHCSTINYLQKKSQNFFKFCSYFNKKRQKQKQLNSKKTQLVFKDTEKLNKLNAYFKKLMPDGKQKGQNRAFLIFHRQQFQDHHGIKFSIDILYCVKIMNAGKLDSHRWFFKGFCQTSQPKTCTIIDCSLQPLANSLQKMYLQLTGNNKVGGVCGHMLLQEQFCPSNNLFDQKSDLVSQVLDKIFSIQLAQKCQYLIAHMLDKNFESFFGFIQVLPGAFSSYRWTALSQNNNESFIILNQYFKDVNSQLTDPYEILSMKNRLLAEDRILCLLLFCNNFTLKYLPNCMARVDSMTTCQTLLSQRRRWINGSNFALDYVLQKQQDYIKLSEHSFISKGVFKMQIGINWYLKYLGYYSIGLYFSSYWVICNQSLNSWLPYQYALRGILFFLLVFLFVLIYFGTFLQSFALDKTTLRPIYHTFAHWFGIFGISTALLTVLNLLSWIKIHVQSNQQELKKFYSQQGFSNNPQLFLVLFWFGIGNIILFIIPLVIFPIIEGNFVFIVQILSSLPHYLFYSPFMVVVMNIVAYSQLDNLSWGTKSIDSVSEEKMTQSLKILKWQISLRWMFRNCLLAICLIILSQFNTGRMLFMLGLLGINGLVMLIKVVFGLLFKLGNCFN